MVGMTDTMSTHRMRNFLITLAVIWTLNAIAAVVLFGGIGPAIDGLLMYVLDTLGHVAGTILGCLGDVLATIGRIL